MKRCRTSLAVDVEILQRAIGDCQTTSPWCIDGLLTDARQTGQWVLPGASDCGPQRPATPVDRDGVVNACGRFFMGRFDEPDAAISQWIGETVGPDGRLPPTANGLPPTVAVCHDLPHGDGFSSPALGSDCSSKRWCLERKRFDVAGGSHVRAC